MKIKAACIGTPKEVAKSLSGSKFAEEVLSKVIGEALGVKYVLNRPAEYYVQKTDVGPSPQENMMGVEVRLTGVSRDGRTPRQFHQAMDTLIAIVNKTVSETLPTHMRCQTFCVIMIDGEIETSPGNGSFSSNLESEAYWVDGTKSS
ncbi:MAG: hypothetical protein AAB840_01245 [Patescibacteria group bacterium]